MNVCKHFHMSCSRMTTPPLKSCQMETEVPLHLPFGRFDSIFFSSKSSIHHLTDPSQTLKSVNRTCGHLSRMNGHGDKFSFCWFIVEFRKVVCEENRWL